MTFELLKVCRQANPAWIELRVTYVRSTVTDRHARWVIINQNYFFLYFVLSFIFFLPFSSYQSISFCFRWFRFISLISFRFRWFRFVSFLFRFALYRYPIFALCWVKICMEKVDKWLPEFTPAIFAQSSVFVDHCLFVLHFLVIVWHIS